MSEELSSFTIPNLIQGVSQQAAAQRRDTQCESQHDCINSPVEGCVARPGARVLKVLPGKSWLGRQFYDIRRDKNEHYLVMAGGGELEVLDLKDGTECTVTKDPSSLVYLGTSGPPRDNLVAATIDDHTFIANREAVPEMTADLSPWHEQEAVFHFRAGAYSTTYGIALIHNGVRYTWTYKTPDNSTSGNADYIATNQLAATFYRALVGTAATVPSSGSSGSGMGPVHGGDAGAVGSISTGSIGFYVELNGATLRVWRTDDQDFGVDSTDGNGDSHLKALRGTVQTFSDLPAKCFDGVIFKIKGSNRQEQDDYYVRYRSVGSGGYWEETLAPRIPYRIDPETMPQALINTDYREFTLGPVEWGDRVAGDEKTSKEPSFIGKSIFDLAYDNSRLAVVLEGGVVWSKNRDPYVFFNDTAQTLLADAPVDYTVSGTREVALLRRMVHKAGLTYLWAEQSQFSVTSNDQGFKAGNIDIKPSTSYEFAERCPPCSVGQSLYFGTEAEPDDDGEVEDAGPGYVTIRDLYVVGDVRTPPQDTDVTAHVPQYIPEGIRWLSASDTLSMMVAVSDGAPSKLFFYNWLISENQRLLSAWNTWRLPSSCVILWAGIYRGNLKLAVQRGSDVLLLAVDLKPNRVDPGVAGAKYATRLDLRVTDTSISRSYDPETDRTTITLPYAASEGTADNFVVIVRSDEALPSGQGRGHIFPTISVSGSQVVVKGDCRGHHLYLGFRVCSERTESTFYLRSENGASLVERLQVFAYDIGFARTGYTRAIVKQTNGKTSTVAMEGRMLGDPANLSDTVVIGDGSLRVPVQCENTGFQLTLKNDSPFPSRWTSAKVNFKVTERTNPRGRSA